MNGSKNNNNNNKIDIKILIEIQQLLNSQYNIQLSFDNALPTLLNIEKTMIIDYEGSDFKYKTEENIVNCVNNTITTYNKLIKEKSNHN